MRSNDHGKDDQPRKVDRKNWDDNWPFKKQQPKKTKDDKGKRQ